MISFTLGQGWGIDMLGLPLPPPLPSLLVLCQKKTQPHKGGLDVDHIPVRHAWVDVGRGFPSVPCS